MLVFQDRIANNLVLTASGNSGTFTTPANSGSALVYLAVSAVSGTTPTLTVTYQTSPDDGATWFDRVASSSITANGNSTISIPNNTGEHARLLYTVGGTTPSFTLNAWFEGKQIAT